MQTALVPEHRTPRQHQQTSLLPAEASDSRSRQPGLPNANPGLDLDALLNQTPTSAPARSTALSADLQIDPPGLFLGLRAALLFNMALGVTGFVVYEIWTAIAH